MEQAKMKNKNTNTYTATDDALIKEVGNGIQAFVLSYIIRRANYKKTTKPEIQKKFIGDALLMSKDILNSSIRKLEENGWFTTEVISRGSKTTVFTLSDKSRKYLGFAHNCQFVEELEEDNAVSEQTTYEQEPQTETVDNHDEQTDTNTNDDIFNDGIKTKEEVQRERQNSPHAIFMTNNQYNDNLPF